MRLLGPLDRWTSMLPIVLLHAFGLRPSRLGLYIQRSGLPDLLISLPVIQSLPVFGKVVPVPPARA